MSPLEPSRPPFAAAQGILAVPTAVELARLRQIAPALFEEGRFQAVELTGFGPVAAVASAAAMVLRHSPAGVLHLGIAGTYDEALAPVGSAVRLGVTCLDGVGAGDGADLLLPSGLGFPQITLDPGGDVHERLRLEGDGPLGLTVCAAASGASMVKARLGRFPGAVLEDMETFGVALGCRMAGAPMVALRGISNHAGDRDHERWRVDAALEAAADQVTSLFFPN